METAMTILGFWWILIPLAAIIFYKWVLRVLFGMIIIPEDRIGIVTKKFVLFGPNKTLPDGRIIALNGESGIQADPLAPGLYWGYWIWQFEINPIEFTTVSSGKIGLIVAKDGAELPMGRILGRTVLSDNFQSAREFLNNGGQKGKQVAYLNTGLYRINTALFSVSLVEISTIEEGQVGIVTALDGEPLPPGQIAGIEIPEHNNFQDFDKFLTNSGSRGLQPQVILAGSYTLNPWAVQIEKVPMTTIPIGYVGVVISYVGTDGKDLTGTDFKHGNIVSRGEKGVWSTPYDPGKYAINTYIMKVELVPTTNLVLNWANARNESHQLDKNLSTITVRSKDGFPYNLDVAQIIHIPSTEAPKVIARFGSMGNLVSQVLEPTIGNYFRNSAQDSDVISFLSTRQERQNAAKEKIAGVLKEYNVHAVDTLIGDIVPPAELMKTLTDRKIASEEQETFNVQQKAQEQKQKLASARALADMQGEIVSAEQSVMIADRMAQTKVKEANGEAESLKLKAKAQSEAKIMMAEADSTQIRLTKQAEATGIEAIGKANAEAYEKQVKAMGSDNFSKFKIMEEIGKNGIKIMPDLLISGGDSNGGTMSALLGLEVLKKYGSDYEKVDTVKIPEKTTAKPGDKPVK
jgi:uncharacterized membrane protein YqiK